MAKRGTPYTGDGKGKALPFVKVVQFLTGRTQIKGGASRLRTIKDVPKGKHRKDG